MSTMTSIEDLPEDIIFIIVKLLDLKSIINLYEASVYLGKILSLPGVVREWPMSLNSMATVQSLKLNFFKDIACHLQEINMCGVIDVCKTTVMPALRRLKNLKTLDVSYTDIDLLDFFDMYDACPTIKNVCINFSFRNAGHKLAQSLILKGQNVFEKMENVHFVGTTFNLLYVDIAKYILQKANLNKLKYTIIHKADYGRIECEGHYKGTVKFKQLFIYFMNVDGNYGNFRNIPVFSNFNLANFEFIIIYNRVVILEEIEVYVTPIFTDFFQNMFRITAKSLSAFNNNLTGNMGILMFNKESNRFDNKFFASLYKRLKNCFPVYFQSESHTPVSDYFNWFYTYPTMSLSVNNNKIASNIQFKKKRVANPSLILDYDAIFKNKTRFKLSISFTDNLGHPVALSPSCDFLSKITFLSLSGNVRYSVEFFNVLFRCCSNLETLDIVAPSISPCVSPVSRSVALSKTLKNLRLIDKRFDFNTFFQSLSQCKTLENIHVLDRSSENTNLADPRMLFKNCDNLYCVCIKACMSNETKRKMNRIFSNAKSSLKKYQLDIRLCQIYMSPEHDQFYYDQYMDVFNVYPIKPGLYIL